MLFLNNLIKYFITIPSVFLFANAALDDPYPAVTCPDPSTISIIQNLDGTCTYKSNAGIPSGGWAFTSVNKCVGKINAVRWITASGSGINSFAQCDYISDLTYDASLQQYAYPNYCQNSEIQSSSCPSSATSSVDPTDCVVYSYPSDC